MNRSCENNRNSDYVHFNTIPQKQVSQRQIDSPDFLAFSDSPQTNPFLPSYYSSPQQNFYKNSPRNYPPNHRWNHRWSNNSFKSRNNGSTSNQSVQEDKDFSKFVHPSFLEDPWNELEAKWKMSQQKQDDKQNYSNTS